MTATNGGRWIFRDVDQHRCPKPGYASTVRAGDQWKCSACNKVWKVTEVKHHHDPRPGESYSELVWADMGVSAPRIGNTSWRD